MKETRIHRLDWPAIGWSLLWPSIIEGTLLLLVWLTSDSQSGAPHNPPSNPISIIYVIVHFPVILLAMPITMGLGLHAPYDAFVVVAFQIILLAYILFVWLRLKKVTTRL